MLPTLPCTALTHSDSKSGCFPWQFQVVSRSNLKSYGDRAFSVAAPRLWNDIPDSIKCNKDLSSFKRDLKTYLFKCYFNE